MVTYDKDITWSRRGYIQSFDIKSATNNAAISRIRFLIIFLCEIQTLSGLNALFKRAKVYIKAKYVLYSNAKEPFFDVVRKKVS